MNWEYRWQCEECDEYLTDDQIVLHLSTFKTPGHIRYTTQGAPYDCGAVKLVEVSLQEQFIEWLEAS